MSKKIGLYIASRRFDVDVENDFAVYLENEMPKDFSIDGNNDLKTLLKGYIRVSHELYKQEQVMKDLIKKL
ncbi:MAG: hypothetical protein U9P72_05810 [Campylobacterota bacterium]|nr:hypothetical protein [Campylobacterota bacterium]